MEVVADQGAVGDLAVTVGHVDIAPLEHVNGPGVRAPDPAFFLAQRVDPVAEVRPARQIERGQGAPDEDTVRMDDLPVALELIAVTSRLQNRPRFLGGGFGHPLEDLVRHLWPAILEPLAAARRSSRDCWRSGSQLRPAPLPASMAARRWG